MYRAKAVGGNQFQFYKEELSDKSLFQFEKEADLRNALANNELYRISASI